MVIFLNQSQINIRELIEKLLSLRDVFGTSSEIGCGALLHGLKFWQQCFPNRVSAIGLISIAGVFNPSELVFFGVAFEVFSGEL